MDDSSSAGSQAKPSAPNHPAEQPNDPPAWNAESKKIRARGQFVRRPIPSLPTRGNDLDETADGWSTLLVRQLREAYVQVDPTSVTFWDDVATLMSRSGKTASECRDKWFALVKTPKPATRCAPTYSSAAHPVVRPSNAVEDDLFNSTPMRAETESKPLELHHLINHLPADQDLSTVAAEPSPAAPSERTIRPDANLRPAAAKPGFKSYLQGMRRDLNRSRKEANRGRPKKATVASKSAAFRLRETFQDDDVKMKVQLSPGGTLQIQNTHADGDENDEDDFWNLYEDDEAE
jgi:hypothetical protein